MTFFSVDVETSGLNPFVPESKLLSVGATAHNGVGNRIDSLYVRIRSELPPAWYDESLPCDSETMSFWREQDQFVKDEAYMDKDLPRFTMAYAGELLRNWVMSFGDDWHGRVFVANPSSFDFMWIQRLWAESGVEDPFSYRTLCLRSAAFGKQLGQGKKVTWQDTSVRTHKPEFPHHPLYDALAQGLDLKELLA